MRSHLSETKRISIKDGEARLIETKKEVSEGMPPKASGCSKDMACIIQQRLTNLETFLENQFCNLSMEQSLLVKKRVMQEWEDYLERKGAVV
ncbi:MAG: hypothetical protein D8M57_13160 [Candidatus Scalindua sp. AMX11]|nr:hypothetical protein [Planctomycetota bacterium]RZV82934.1 MAG: hypothetical protein EX341_09085 [Candidatus Scalindua sp. SCAELEC01]TDE64444.1 MAG: hypothetical protein D8M57_13160 [Candidatus Scalindua sp. AMX11]GJQ59771.1 MAG: hypothetical protein SCALA701_25720 [Candidatus Scalindua sp.]